MGFCKKRVLSEKNLRAQTGVEYLILVGFITLVIISILGLSVFLSSQLKDRIKLNQVESFSVQLIHSAEAVFFAGEPSKTTVNLYLPDGVTDIDINGTYFIVTTHVASGENKRGYSSKVPLSGAISPGEGLRKISLQATENYVLISG